MTKYGITDTVEIVHNPSFELLFEEETRPELTGFDKGQVSELGAVNVMTGEYTGRSPKDKFIVMDENSKDTVGGLLTNIRMITIRHLRKPGRLLRTLRLKSCPARSCMLLTLSAVPTKIHAWLSVSSWKWPGRHIL